MKHTTQTLTAAVLLALLGGTEGAPARAASPAHHLKTPPASYLRYQVYTVDQLIQEVQQDPAVRHLYARHFQIPERSVVPYMRANLVQSWVPRTGRYTVYCVSRTGKLYPVQQTFRKGTKVFALRNGQPVMKWICGNPLTHTLPAMLTKTLVRPPRVVAKVSPSIQELTPSEAADVLVPDEGATVAALPAIPFSAATASLPALTGGGGGFPFAGLLPLLGLFALHHSGGGNSPGPAPAPVVTPNVPVPAAVPEVGGWPFCWPGCHSWRWARSVGAGEQGADAERLERQGVPLEQGSYMLITRGMTVRGTDADLGTVAEVVADENVDVFRGLVLSHGLLLPRQGFLSGDHVVSVVGDVVQVDISQADAERLPPPSASGPSTLG